MRKGERGCGIRERVKVRSSRQKNMWVCVMVAVPRVGKRCSGSRYRCIYIVSWGIRVMVPRT